MYSINFGGKDSWSEWKLLPTSRPRFVMPSIKTRYVDIPGANGQLDLTTLLTGEPTYGNRVGSFEFIVSEYKSGYDWVKTYSELAEHFHGKNMRAILSDDPLYFYEGRFALNQWISDKSYSRIVIDYNVGPFKKLLSDPSSIGVL